MTAAAKKGRKGDKARAGGGVDGEVEYLKVVPDVTRKLNVSRSTVYLLMDRGELGYVKFGRSRRVPREALEDFIKRNTVPAGGRAGT